MMQMSQPIYAIFVMLEVIDEMRRFHTKVTLT